MLARPLLDPTIIVIIVTIIIVIAIIILSTQLQGLCYKADPSPHYSQTAAWQLFLCFNLSSSLDSFIARYF